MTNKKAGRSALTDSMARPNVLQHRIGYLLDRTRSRAAVNRTLAIVVLVTVTMISGMVSVLRPISMADEPVAVTESVVASEPHIRGEGEAAEIRLHGIVIDEEESPVTDPSIEITLRSVDGERSIEPTISGNTFETWLPISGVTWHNLSIEARRDTTSNELAHQYIARNELRGIATTGMRVQLQRPTGFTEVRVSEGNQPVPNASVQVGLRYGRTIIQRTDGNGTARIDLYENEKPSALTAWTDDYRVGGYQFSRQPVRDAEAAVHYVELSKCRDQTIRMIDEEGNGIEGVEFQMQLATPSPYINYIGTTDLWRLRTNASGEAVSKYFPDWPEVQRYAELLGNDWFIHEKATQVDGQLVITLRRRTERKRVMGTLTGMNADLAGIGIRAGSFQAEREDYSDQIFATTDAEGRFWIDVLPGSTYSIRVDDPQRVSDYSDVMAFDPENSQVNAPQLILQKGVIAKVKLTAGPDQVPIANEHVRFNNKHSYKWMEDGEPASGQTGRSISVLTDENGIATAVVRPGTVEVSVYQNDWRGRGSIEATEDGENFTQMHREIAEARVLTGRLVAAKGDKTSWGGLELTIGAIDGKTQDERTLPFNGGTEFSFETAATKIGVVAITNDEQFAGVAIVTDLTKPIVVTMHPTQTIRGRVTQSDGSPVAGRTITAYGNLTDPTATQTVDPFGTISFPTRVSFLKRTTTSDSEGSYEITGLPCLVPTTLYAEGQDWSLDEVYLQPGEQRPPLNSTLRGATQEKPSDESLAQRWSDTVRNCKLGGYHPMVIIAHETPVASAFADEHLTNGGSNPVAAQYMVLTYHPDQADAEFARNRHWTIPAEGELTAIACNGAGTELGRETFDANDPADVDRAAAFLVQHAPAEVDADKAWEEAFALAKQTDRRVWVRISGRYCAPCFTFARWLDDHREVLNRDFVMLKLEPTATSDLSALTNRLTNGKHFGIPFHAIFAADETKIIDSQGPLGNIGSPSGLEGKRHLRKMLDAGCKRSTPAEMQAIVSRIAN